MDMDVIYKLTTPFDVLKTFEQSLKHQCDQQRTCTIHTALKWNKKEVTVTGTYGRETIDFSIVTPSKNKLTVKGSAKREGSTKDANAELRWNANHILGRISFDYRSPNKRDMLLWEAKIDGVCDLKLRAEQKDSDSKMTKELLFKQSADVYKATVELDKQSNEGVVKVQTPYTEMKTAKLEVTRISDGKYTIKTERNGQEGAVVTGELSASDKKQVAKISITNIEKQIEIDAEFQERGNGLLKLIATVDQQSYGIHMSQIKERSGSPTSPQSKRIEGLQITLIHPKRRPQIKLMETKSSSGAKGEIQMNADTSSSSSEPTVFAIVNNWRDKEYSAYISDPRLSHPIKVIAKPRNDGLELRLVYSDLDSKVFKVQMTMDKRGRGELTFTHEASNLHQKYWAEYVPNLFSCGLEYKAQDKKIKNLSLKVDNRRGNTVEISTPNSQGKLKFELKQVKNNEKEHRMMWFESGKTKPNWVIAAKIEPEKSQYVVELRKAASGNVVLHLSDQLIDEDTHETRVWHMQNKKKLHDVYGKLWLAKPNLLKYRLHVRPEAWKDIVDTISQFGKSNGSKQADANVLHDIMLSWADAYKVTKQQLSEHAQPMNNYWDQEMTQMGKDFGVPKLIEMLGEYGEIVSELWGAQLDIMEMTLRDWADSMGPSMKNVKVLVNDAFKLVKKSMKQLLTPLGQLFESIADILGDIVKEVGDLTKAINDYLKSNKFFKTIGEFLEELVKQIRRVLRRADLDKLSGQVNDYLVSMEAQYGNTVQYARDYLDAMLQYSSVRDVYDSMQPMLDEIATIDIRDLVDRLFKFLRSFAEGQPFSKSMIRVVEYNPEEGRLEFEVPLPVKVKNLRGLLKMVEPERFTRIAGDVGTQMNELFSTSGPISDELWERKAIRRPAYSIDRSSLSSTHKSTAYIVNDGKHSNVITFDGHSYKISRGCEMLLARDFIDDKFTIIGEFAKKGAEMRLDTIVVRYSDEVENEIKLTDDGKVLINNNEEELPWQQIEKFSQKSIVGVKRNDHGVVLKTFDGIVVKRDWFYSTSTVSLPGYYHGHSAGLLGSNDNEHSNDLHLSNGNVNDNVDRFLESYNVGGDCQPHSTAPHAESAECRRLFRERNSPMRTCFRRVPPRAFHDMCSSSNVCNVTASYVAACHDTGLDSRSVFVPEHCLECTPPNARRSRRSQRIRRSTGFTGGDTRRVEENIVKNADVVFVVMEQPCMSFAKDKVVPVAEKIKEKLGGFNSVHFGLVGFHGLGVHNEPHFHTGDFKLNFPLTGLRKAVQELDFDDVMQMADTQDPLEAVRYTAVNFPFRTATMKTMVLWTCAIQCGSQDYYGVQMELLQRGIQLHVLTTEQIQVSADQGAEMMGFDASRVFTTSGAQTQLRQSLTWPHDSCTVLAQETHGTVWTVHDRESAVYTTPGVEMADRVKGQYARTDCIECECQSLQRAPRTECYPCSVLQPVSLSGSSFFNLPYVRLQQTWRKAQNAVGSVDLWMV
jgi:hypothetical protein